MQLQARDKRALIGGAVVVTGLLAILLWPRAPGGGGVELVAASERAANPQAAATPTSTPAPAVAAAPPVQPGVPTGPRVPGQGVPVQAAAAPGGAPDSLRLTGVTATGAIFAFSDGSQRLVQRGREVAPGLVLETVRVREVILAGNGTSLRLTFGGPATPVQAPAQAPVTAAVPAPGTPPLQPTPPPDRSLFR